MNDFENLEAVYGPAAPYSEHKRGDRVRYISAEGQEKSGVVEWCQARFESIPMKYIIAPDEPGQFLDFALPGDILTQEQEQVSGDLTRCPYCQQMHQADMIEQCPMKKKS